MQTSFTDQLKIISQALSDSIKTSRSMLNNIIELEKFITDNNTISNEEKAQLSTRLVKPLYKDLNDQFSQINIIMDAYSELVKKYF